MIVTITVLTADGRPAQATFRFGQSLESPSSVSPCFRPSAREIIRVPALRALATEDGVSSRIGGVYFGRQACSGKDRSGMFYNAL
jgi:hypothetical protein